MLEEVRQVAFRLFAEQGFEKTTVEQIAAQSGLSRTTFFRYFGSKEEIILGRISEIGVMVAEALKAISSEEIPWKALRQAFETIVTGVATDEKNALVMMRLLSDASALTTRRWEKEQGWQSLLVPLILPRLNGNLLQANALVASAICCLEAATDEWMACKNEVPLGLLLDQSMEIFNR